MEKSSEIALSHFLSMAGVDSRRKCTALIKEGHVEVNGELITNPGFRVNPETDKVTCNNRNVKVKQRTYIMLYKPRGFACTNEDRFAEKTVFDLVKVPGKRLFTVGRLDVESEGLLLITDDGDYAEKLTHPRNQVRKVYVVKTNKPLPEESIAKLKKGIYCDGELLKAHDIIPQSKFAYRFVLTEGKKREIRRMLMSERLKVSRLKRIMIGKLTLGSLKPAQWHNLSPEQVKLSLES